MNIYHFYHIYAGPYWEDAVKDHCDAILETNFQNVVDKIFIGLLGPEESRNKVKLYLDSKGIVYEIITEKENGWEQETLIKLYEFSLFNDGKVFYGHTKGAVNKSSHQDRWRLGMIESNLKNWEINIARLDKYDAVGCWWRPHDPFSFFEGNFWWSNLNIIRQLGYPRMDDRWWAECWIGSSGITNVYDLVNDFKY